MAQFKAGDKVRWGDLAGVVRFGPYTSELGNQGRYLVECAANGRCYAVSGSALSPALEIGDKVTVADLSGTFTLAAGPWTFPREPGGPQYVVTDDAGNAYVEAAALVHAAAPEADQPHAWRDRQGDIWYPVGVAAGEQRYSTSADDGPGQYYYTLDGLRVCWGPLERVAPEVDQPHAWRDRQGDIWYPLGEAEGEQRYGMEFGEAPNRYGTTLEKLRETWGPLEPAPSIPEPATEGATAKDASGDIWHRHGTGSDGVGRWSMRPLGSAAVALDRMSTWQRIVTNFGPMSATQ